jgi:hypothetical protein
MPDGRWKFCVWDPLVKRVCRAKCFESRATARGFEKGVTKRSVRAVVRRANGGARYERGGAVHSSGGGGGEMLRSEGGGSGGGGGGGGELQAQEECLSAGQKEGWQELWLQMDAGSRAAKARRVESCVVICRLGIESMGW